LAPRITTAVAATIQRPDNHSGGQVPGRQQSDYLTMRSSIRKSFAATLVGLGLSASAVLAEPKSGSKTDPPAKSDPKPVVIVPKADPKPTPLPMPVPPPKVEPKIILPVIPKDGPKPHHESEVKLPVKPVVPVIDPKLPVVPVKGEIKVTKPDFHPVVIHEKPLTGGIVEMPKGPGLKLPSGAKFDHAELAKIKPPVDLTKTKPEVVLGSKPPADFKMKPIKLDIIHVPHDAPVVEKLGIGSIKGLTVNQTFIVNKSYYTKGDYHLKFGTKTAYGYCYPGKWHTHWHHSIRDPCFNCYYFYCPSTSCYYYWCETDYCYYPCHWFVEYSTCYYPWWICGGFGGYGYVAKPSFGIYIGW
jgi:hypothetical protein